MPNFFDALRDPAFRRQVTQDLLDSANRGLVASTLGAPVDLATSAANLGIAGAGYIGHKAGLIREPFPLIDESQAVGSSEWIGKQMEQRGLVSPNRNPIAETGFAMLAPVAGMGAQKVGRTVARADLAMAENAANAERMPRQGQRGAFAWHGTPHEFEQFDASKIGSGEGAQVYGRGLYFAESKDVAKSYQKALAPKVPKIDADNDKKIIALVDFAVSNLDKESARNAFARMPSIAGWLRGASWDEASSAMLSAAGKTKNKEMKSLLEKDAMLAKKMGQAGAQNPYEGMVYKVDIPDASIEKMIDWDNGGERMWRDAVEKYGSAKNAADALRASGIPGIKYLDSGSRGVGAGSRNFVVFPGEESTVKIVERNGKPVAKP